MGSRLAQSNYGQPKVPFGVQQGANLHLSKSKSDIDKAYQKVLEAQKAFDRVDTKVTHLLNQRSALVLAEAAYRGLFDDHLNYGVHSIENMSITSDELTSLVTMIIKNNKDKGLITAINNRITDALTRGHITAGADYLIKNLSEAFLSPFATFPNGTKKTAKQPSNKPEAADIAKGIITSNTNLKAVIARGAIFYVLFKQVQTKYKKNVGFDSLKKTSGSLNDKLTDLQDAIRNYNSVSSSPMLVPGLISATGGKSAYYSILREYQMANANRVNIVNSADANVLMREIAQQISQQLQNIANTLHENQDTADIDLHGIITKESMELIDNYHMVKNSKSMAEQYGSLLNASRKGYKLTLSLEGINKHIGGLSKMIKLLTDEGSRKLIALQDATFKKNNASEELSKLIRRYFSALDAAFGLPSE